MDVLDELSQSFYLMKALWVQMIDLDLLFRFVKGHECGLILPAFFAIGIENELEYLYQQ